MDKELGRAYRAKDCFHKRFPNIPKWTGPHTGRVIYEVSLTPDEMISTSGTKFVKAFIEALTADTSQIDSLLTTGVIGDLREAYINVNKLVSDLERQAYRTALLRKADQRFPSLQLRTRAENIFPGITGLTAEEIDTIHQTVMSKIQSTPLTS